MLGPRAGGTGVFILGGTLFVIPLEESLGLQRSTTALLFALGSMMAGISAIASGAMMDRYGPRLVLLGSVLISAIGYLLFALAPNTIVLFIVFIFVISPVVLNVAFNASAAYINNWFDRSKATAMSILQVGSGLGAIIILPALAFAIDSWNWRIAAVVGAAFIVVFGLPAALFSRNTPEELGLLPDGEEWTPEANAATVSEPTTNEALRTRSFWFLVASVFCFGGAQAALSIHFVPIMVWKGIDEVEGAFILTVMAVVSTPAVLIMGPLADRLGRLKVAGLTSVLVAVGVVLLILSDGRITIWGAALIMAPNFGMYPLIWAALGHAFGRKAFSTIRGGVMALQAPATLGLPILGGVLFDSMGSYASVLWIIACLWAAAAALLFLAPSRSHVVVTAPETGPTTSPPRA
jgi:MFS family permease